MLSEQRLFQDPRRAAQFGFGAVSPLWSTFFVAASAGVAYLLVKLAQVAGWIR